MAWSVCVYAFMFVCQCICVCEGVRVGAYVKFVSKEHSHAHKCFKHRKRIH